MEKSDRYFFTETKVGSKCLSEFFLLSMTFWIYQILDFLNLYSVSLA